MADYTLKNVPEPLRSKLESEAQRSFRSVDQEILFRLQRSFDADDTRMTALHAKWIYDALNSGEAAPLKDTEIDAAFSRGLKRAKTRKQTSA
jgi:hypothetical protein